MSTPHLDPDGQPWPTTPNGTPHMTGSNPVHWIDDWTRSLAATLDQSFRPHDDTGALITPASIGAAPAEHTHTAYADAITRIENRMWYPLTPEPGITGALSYTIRNSVLYLSGRATRTAGNWPSTFTTIAKLPSTARPPELIYMSGVDRAGRLFPVAMFATGELRVAGGASTGNEIELGSVTPLPLP